MNKCALKETIIDEIVSSKENLTKDAVWGDYDLEKNERISDGLVVARHGDKCPIFKDVLPYKSVTVICNEELEVEVIGWLCYVHGGNCVSLRKRLKHGKVALRSNYQCW